MNEHVIKYLYHKFYTTNTLNALQLEELLTLITFEIKSSIHEQSELGSVVL